MAKSTFRGSAFAGYQPSIVRLALLLSVLLPVLGVAAEQHQGDEGALAQEPLAWSWRTPPRIRILWIDQGGALPFSSSFVALEVRGVFATLGVVIDWVEVGSEPIEDPEALRVILLRAEPSAWRFGGSVLGIVSKAPASERTIWVVLSNVRKALGLHPSGSAADRHYLARALGRVTVHEVVHAVAPWHAHASTGLMRESLDRWALVGSSVDLDLESRKAILSTLAPRQPVRLARWPSAGRGLPR